MDNYKNLELVKNCNKYWEFIATLRSDTRVQNGFISQVSSILATDQEDYMEKYNNNYMVCLEHGLPVGYIGEISGDLRLCVSPNKQSRGIGTFMIREFTRKNKDVFAKIKITNLSSIRAFEKSGFQKTKGSKEYIFMEPSR